MQKKKKWRGKYIEEGRYEGEDEEKGNVNFQFDDETSLEAQYVKKYFLSIKYEKFIMDKQKLYKTDLSNN